MDPHDASRFPRLDDDQMEWVLQLGQVIPMEDGQEILTEGQDGYDFFIVESGRLQITKQAAGGATVLRVHEPREFVGELSLLAGGPSPITARAVGRGRVVRLTLSALRDVLSNCPEMSAMVIPALARRVHDVEGLLQEREKLAALGKLAAGLAHELNNPVAAGSRAVAGVRQMVVSLRDHALLLGQSNFSPEEVATIREHLARASERIAHRELLDPLAQSDREEAIGTWMEERGCENPWEVAGSLVAGGFDVPDLEALVGRYDAEAAERILDFVATQLAVESLLHDAEHSLSRIGEIVRAVKGYSRMDEAPLTEVNLQQGIEDTLKMLAYPLRPYRIVRDYAPDVPEICAFGGELNQVWTNIIDNAIGAMGGEGTLTIRTARHGEHEVRVEISDTGPGIPEDVQPRIFDAFFTTKPAGEGTGLGLDIARRIVTVRHNGRIDFQTGPGGTTFQVVIPIQRPA